MSLDTVDLQALARVGQALADENRRRILVMLLDGPAHPADVADQLQLSRSNVSNHLACLRDCGLVVGRPQGRRVRYELAHPGLSRALRELCSVTLDPITDSCSGPGDMR